MKTLGRVPFLLLVVGLLVVVGTGGLPTPATAAPPPPGACVGYQAWVGQSDPQTDPAGSTNLNYPEASSTAYFSTPLNLPAGTVVTIKGRYPFARFMSFETYTGDQLVDFLSDTNIVPDSGQNNPYIAGTVNGTYTAFLVFGDKPASPAPNTVYTGPNTNANLRYRIYHTTNPNDPAGGATNPILPDLWLNGQHLASCPVQPIIVPEDTTTWGRLDNADWSGAIPTGSQVLGAVNPPQWAIADPTTAHYFPNGSNFYMGTLLSRQFLAPATTKNLYVVRFKAPTYPKTRSGEPVWADRQVRFWSLCTDDPYTTGVNRCLPDDAAVQDPNGFVTFVISDPGSKPVATALTRYRASWIAWGALDLPTDYLFDRSYHHFGITSPVNYYNLLLIRQTEASSTFTQSFMALSPLPRTQAMAAMGSYWPVGGYCSTAGFQSSGISCVANGT